MKLEEAQKKAERMSGKETIAINEIKKAWIFTFSYDECDDFIVISKKDGSMLNYDYDDLNEEEMFTIWEK